MQVANAMQLQAYDRALVAGGYTMEALVDMASELLVPHCQGFSNVVIFCGNGNNGSDGLSLANKLQAQGKQVQVVLVSDSPRRGGLNQALLEQLYCEKVPVLDSVAIPEEALVVDAMLGFGFVGVPRAQTLGAIGQINRHRGTVLSVDIPSGLHCDGFQRHAPMVKASKTVSFVAVKQGFLDEDSKRYLGELVIAPLPVEVPCVLPPLATLFDRALAKETLKPREYATYKGKQGHALLVTGSDQYRGAGLLSTKACVYSGCGLTSWCGFEPLAQWIVGHTPEVIGQTMATAMATVSNKTALLIGSRLGLSEACEQWMRWALEETTLPLVIDGDGLTMLARNPGLLDLARGRAILTPHMGEFARFDPEGVSPIDQAYGFAKAHGVVLVLKGPHTIVTDGQRVFRATTGNRRMATAGSGDVLAGVIVALLAGGYTPMEAANLGVYLHGGAGDAVAQTHYTAVPSLVIEQLPQVMHQLRLE